MNLMIVGFLALIFIGLLFHQLILGWLQEVLPPLRARLAVTLRVLSNLTRRAFLWAGYLVTQEGRLSPSQAMVQTAVGLLMLIAMGSFLLCDFSLAHPTLSALMGLRYRPILSGFDWLLALSLMFLAVVAGAAITDLRGWTSGRLASIGGKRALLYYTALFCFVMSLAVGAALGLYRWGTMREESAVWLQSLSAFILVSLAVILLMGAALAFLLCESSFPSLVAVSIAAGGMALGVVYLVLLLIDFATEVALDPAVKMTLRFTEDRRQRPPKRRPYEAPVVEKPGVPVNGSNPSGKPSHNPEASALAGPNGKDPRI